MDIRLRFVAQAKTQGEVRPRPPVVSYERSHIHLAGRGLGEPRVNAELRGAASQRADLRRRESLLLVEQRPPIPLDGLDRRRIRSRAACKSKCAAKVLG